MFFGITFFVNQDKVADPVYITENVAPENNETQPATYSEPDSKPQNEEVVAPVSYTHLDVYKRQILETVSSIKGKK